MKALLLALVFVTGFSTSALAQEGDKSAQIPQTETNKPESTRVCVLFGSMPGCRTIK